jgi:enoyl-CoA hydratase/carnithine racemase
MSLVEVERTDAIATLWLNRPDSRNALSVDMCDAIVASLARLDRDDQARVLLVRGRGSVFCSGADFAAVSGAGGLEFLPAFERMLEAVARHRLPTIAVIQGAALGGGLQLATVCDFRVADDSAKLGIPSSKLGILVNFENVERLVLLAGIGVAKEVLMTGRTFSGEEAWSAGLLTHRVLSDEEAERTALDLARDIAARAPLSVQGTKRAIQAVVDHLGAARETRTEAVDEIDRLVASAYNSRDLQEGIAAMKEKRAPEFGGI